MRHDNSWAQFSGMRLSRRTALRGSAATAMTGLIAAACSGSSSDEGGSAGKAGGTAPAAGAVGTQGAAASGGTVAVRGVELPSLDPYSIITQNAQVPAAIWYNRLYRFKSGPDIKPRQYVVEPEVAAAQPEMADQGMTVAVKLRPDVRFHDKPPVAGRAVTSEDISYTFDRFRALSGRKSVFDNVAKVETPDAQTVVFRLSSPSASFVSTLADGSFLHIIPKEIVDPSNKAAKGDPIGAGPWVFDSYQAGVVANATANPAYFRGRPKPDKFQFLLIPEPASASAAFRTGKIDQFAPTVDDLKSLESIRGAQVLSFPSGAYSFVSFDLTGIFKDIRLRRAAGMAIDRDKFNQSVFEGKGDWCTVLPAGFTPWYLDPKGSGYGNSGASLKYDPKSAQALVKEAGYSGQPIKLSSSTQFDKNQIELTAAMLQAVGFSIQINLMEHAAFIQTVNAGINLGGGLAWVVKPSYPDPTSYLQIYWAPGSPNQNTRFDDKDILDLINKQDVTVDTDQRAKIIRDIQIAIADRAYGAFLVTNPAFSAISARAQNYNYIDNVSGIEGWAAAAIKS